MQQSSFRHLTLNPVKQVIHILKSFPHMKFSFPSLFTNGTIVSQISNAVQKSNSNKLHFTNYQAFWFQQFLGYKKKLTKKILKKTRLHLGPDREYIYHV